MNVRTGWLLVAALLSTSAAAQENDSPEALKARIESLRPEKLAWKQVDWLNCPLEALRRSRTENKPIIVWVFLGNPSDERC